MLAQFFEASGARPLARALALSLVLCFAPLAHAGPGGEGHTHGEDAVAPASSASPRAAMTGETLEAVAIYKGDALSIYLHRLSDNAPVENAKVEVTIGAADSVEASVSGGVYRLQPVSLAEGTHEILVSVTSPGGDDLLAGTMTREAAAGHAAGVHGDHTTSGLTQRLHDLWTRANLQIAAVLLLTFAVGLFFGRVFRSGARRNSVSLLLALALVSAVHPEAALAGPGGEGHTHGDEGPTAVSSDSPQRLQDGSVFLPKPTQRLLDIRTAFVEEAQVPVSFTLRGRVIADPQGAGAVQSINGGRLRLAGDRLPRLGQRVEKGQLLAVIEQAVTVADKTTLIDKAGEIGQQISLAESRVKRLSALAATNTVPRTQVADLELELDSLIQRRKQIGAQQAALEELRAPVSGEISVMRAAPGRVFGPQEEIFQIIEPNRLWIEAQAFGGFDPQDVGSAAAQLSNGRSAALRLEGVGPALQMHASQVQFSVVKNGARLAVGEPVLVNVQRREQRRGILLPADAVVRAPNGELVAWQLVAPEKVARKPVRTAPGPAGHVIVIGGLEAGQRIVVRGAEYINQIR